MSLVLRRLSTFLMKLSTEMWTRLSSRPASSTVMWSRRSLSARLPSTLVNHHLLRPHY